MSAVEVITEIKKLPQVQRRKVYKFVDEQLRHEEDRCDNEAANRSLKERGENIPWAEAREQSSKASTTAQGKRVVATLLRGGKIKGRTRDWLQLTRR